MLFNNMLRMDAGGINEGKKVIVNVDHITGIEERSRERSIIHLIDGAAIYVNENINDIWSFMYAQQNEPTYTSVNKPFDPDKKVERKHVM